jgi:hypothetical protein
MTIFITKWALTRGILKFGGAELDPDHPDRIASVPGKRLEHFHGSEWHVTWEAAVDNAEKRRDLKIVSLEKQIQKLREMTFDAPGESR